MGELLRENEKSSVKQAFSEFVDTVLGSTSEVDRVTQKAAAAGV